LCAYDVKIAMIASVTEGTSTLTMDSLDAPRSQSSTTNPQIESRMTLAACGVDSRYATMKKPKMRYPSDEKFQGASR
jgi:hypothetical protein